VISLVIVKFGMIINTVSKATTSTPTKAINTLVNELNFLSLNSLSSISFTTNSSFFFFFSSSFAFISSFKLSTTLVFSSLYSFSGYLNTILFSSFLALSRQVLISS
jgi:hypothetical protein